MRHISPRRATVALAAVLATAGLPLVAPVAPADAADACLSEEQPKDPLLGTIPIDTSLREGGDTGKPIVESDPTAPGATALTSIAEKLSGRGRGLAGMQLGLTPTSKF